MIITSGIPFFVVWSFCVLMAYMLQTIRTHVILLAWNKLRSYEYFLSSFILLYYVYLEIVNCNHSQYIDYQSKLIFETVKVYWHYNIYCIVGPYRCYNNNTSLKIEILFVKEEDFATQGKRSAQNIFEMKFINDIDDN